jgi:hypothetical protein
MTNCVTNRRIAPDIAQIATTFGRRPASTRARREQDRPSQSSRYALDSAASATPWAAFASRSVRLSYCTVAAPISGVVLSTRVSPGQLVSFISSTKALRSICDGRWLARASIFYFKAAAFSPPARLRLYRAGAEPPSRLQRFRTSPSRRLRARQECSIEMVISCYLDTEAREFPLGGPLLERAFPCFADDPTWWAEAAKMEQQRKEPPF